MKIGILGSGDVAQRLADGFIATGHTAKIGKMPKAAQAPVVQ